MSVLPSNLVALAVISAKQKPKVYLSVTFLDMSFVHTLAACGFGGRMAAAFVAAMNRQEENLLHSTRTSLALSGTISCSL